MTLNQMQPLEKRLPGLKRDLVTWALKYRQFRAELVADARTVVEREFGQSLPHDLQVQVLEESDEKLCLVIPQNPYRGAAAETQAKIEWLEVARFVTGSGRVDGTLAEEMADPTAQLIARAWRDPLFKRALLEDPKEALEEALGTTLETGQSLQVVEETDHQIYLVLPNHAVSGGELGEEYSEDLVSLASKMVAGSPPTSFGLC